MFSFFYFFALYILVYTKNEIRKKKKKKRFPTVFLSTRRTGKDYSLKGGLNSVNMKMCLARGSTYIDFFCVIPVSH